MRRKNLLTQVLVANLLLIVAAVVVTADRRQPRAQPRPSGPGWRWSSAFAVALTILVNVFMLQRRFRPLERLVDEMERADLSRPGANLRSAPRTAGAGPRRSPASSGAFRADARAPRRRAAPDLERRARCPGGGARAGRPRPSRRGQPVADRPAAAARGGPGEGAGRARRRARRDEGARQPGDAGAPDARPPAPPHRARRPRPQGGARRRTSRELGRRGGSSASFESDGDFSGLPADVQLVVYRVAQEALSNAAQHSGAEHVRVRPARARATGSS